MTQCDDFQVELSNTLFSYLSNRAAQECRDVESLILDSLTKAFEDQSNINNKLNADDPICNPMQQKIAQTNVRLNFSVEGTDQEEAHL